MSTALRSPSSPSSPCLLLSIPSSPALLPSYCVSFSPHFAGVCHVSAHSRGYQDGSSGVGRLQSSV